MKKSIVCKSTCTRCGDTFWCTEAYKAMVIAGKKESLCENCDKDYKEEKQ